MARVGGVTIAPMSTSKLPLSVAIVCKNNEATIERTLASIAPLASQIVALDSGSTDRTIEILTSYGARVERVQWQGHVRTKQAALETCSHDWILSLDSDESVEPELADSIRELITRNDPAIAGAYVNRAVFYRGRFLRHAWQPEWRLRLVRRGAARWTGLDPHDKLELLHGGSTRLRGILRHDSFSTFADHFRAQCAHSRTMAASLRAAGKRGSYVRLLTSPAGAFLKQLVIKRGFLDGYPGWLAAASTAAGALMKHAILIELSRENT